MFTPRSTYASADYSPSEASQYSYGGIVPSPRIPLLSKLKQLRNISTDVPGKSPSASFQRFLLLQQNPEALALSQMRLPNTPFGNLGSFMSYGSMDGFNPE